MWELPPGATTIRNVVNNILEQTSKPELAKYLYTALLFPTTESLIKTIKQGFLKTWRGLTKN